MKPPATTDDQNFLNDVALPPLHAAFDAECRDARRLAESRGLLSLTFALCDGVVMTEVSVINRRSGLARQYPRMRWLVALREELDGGLLGPTRTVGAAMRKRLDLARGAGESSAE